jgi:hypothetical protein
LIVVILQKLKDFKKRHSFSFCNCFDDVVFILRKEEEGATVASTVCWNGIARFLIGDEDLFSVVDWLEWVDKCSDINSLVNEHIPKQARHEQFHLALAFGQNDKIFNIYRLISLPWWINRRLYFFLLNHYSKHYLWLLTPDLWLWTPDRLHITYAVRTDFGWNFLRKEFLVLQALGVNSFENGRVNNLNPVEGDFDDVF